MTVVVGDRRDVNVENLRRVALGGEGVRLSEEALAQVAASHESFQRYVESHQDGFIYMVTSGPGPDAKSRYSLEQSRNRRKAFKPFRTLSFGGGELPEYVSRGVLFATLATLVAGTSATHPLRVQAMAAALDRPLPRLPARGLVSAGELMPRFVLRPALEASIENEGFSAGTGNGSPAAGAMAGLAAIFARRRLELVEALFALSVEAFRAPLEAYLPEHSSLWPDPADQAALAALARLLAGASPERRRSPAPLSLRLLPGLLGEAERAVAILEEVAETALGEAASNPTFIAPSERSEGEAISTGGYHNATAAPAIDSVAAAFVDLATVAHRHAVKLHKGPVAELPDRLIPEGSDYMSGFSTTYLEYTPNQALEEMRRLARPTLLSPTEVAASEQDDMAITAPIAFLAEREVAARLDEVMAVLAATCSQALHLRGGSPVVAPGLEALLAGIRRHVPPVESRRPLGEECGRLAAAFSEAVEEGTTGEWTGL